MMKIRLNVELSRRKKVISSYFPLSFESTKKLCISTISNPPLCFSVIFFSSLFLSCVLSLHETSYKNKLMEHGIQFCPRSFNCSEVKYVTILDQIGEGAVKKVYRGLWSNHYFAVNVLKEAQFSEDFFVGLNLMQLLNTSPLVVKLVGICKERGLFLSEFHQFGDARNVHKTLDILSVDSIENRFKFCISYVEILEFLHSKDNGVKVMCDSNDLQKTLSQYLITDQLQLVLSDLDALPSLSEVADRRILCGHREITSPFAAPEQLWPYPNISFNPETMPKYDEKTDIWKVPNVCEYFLGSFVNNKIMKYLLFEIHKSCKSKKPNERPCATTIKKVYLESLDKIIHHDEL